MPASPKRPSKKTTTPRVKRPAKASAAKPFLRFYHQESLRAKTLDVLTTLEKAEDAKPHRGALADIVVELTNAGMDYYFLRPLKIAKVSFFVEQSANLGMGATKRLFASVIRNIIGGMDNAQLLSVCSYIRQLMK